MKPLILPLLIITSANSLAEDRVRTVGSIGTRVEQYTEEEQREFVKFTTNNNSRDNIRPFTIEIDSDGRITYSSLGLIKTDPNVEYDSNNQVGWLNVSYDKRRHGIKRKQLSIIQMRSSVNSDEPVFKAGGLELDLVGEYDLGYEHVDVRGLEDALEHGYGEVNMGFVASYDHNGDYKVLGTIKSGGKMHFDADYKETNSEARLELFINKFAKRTGRPLYFFVSKNLDNKTKIQTDSQEFEVEDSRSDVALGFEVGF